VRKADGEDSQRGLANECTNATHVTSPLDRPLFQGFDKQTFRTQSHFLSNPVCGIVSTSSTPTTVSVPCSCSRATTRALFYINCARISPTQVVMFALIHPASRPWPVVELSRLTSFKSEAKRYIILYPLDISLDGLSIPHRCPCSLLAFLLNSL
jgi:hypothetical protein